MKLLKNSKFIVCILFLILALVFFLFNIKTYTAFRIKEIKAEALKRPNISVEVLRKLSCDEDLSVRIEVAKNPNTPPDVLKAMINDESYFVRREIAGNKLTPPDALRIMAEKELSGRSKGMSFSDIKFFYGEFFQTEDDYKKLSDLPLIKIIGPIGYYLAKNPNTPPEVAAKLTAAKIKNKK